jgi:curli biogenesis system outer membrane secretion channel CsgG
MTKNRVFGLVALGAMVIAGAASAQQRKRIAVLPFTTSTEAAHNASANAGINGDLGADVADLLMHQLFQDKQFIVVERSAIDKIVKEQNFSNSDRADPATAARIGKLAGVDAMIIGSVTNFTFQKRGTGVGNALGRLHLGAAGVDTTTTNVGITITARMIDTGTGVLVNDVSGTGASNGTSTNAAALGGSSYDPSGANFSSSLIGQAMLKAVGTVATSLEPKGPPMAGGGGGGGAAAAYSGVVADVTGKTLILTVGTSAGVKVGDVVSIVHPVKTVKNPETGEVLKVITSDLGEAKITECDASSATATYMGTGTVAVNDKATLKQ